MITKAGTVKLQALESIGRDVGQYIKRSFLNQERKVSNEQ